MLILGIVQTLTRWAEVLFHVLGFREYCQTAHCSTLWVFHVQREVTPVLAPAPGARIGLASLRSPGPRSHPPGPGARIGPASLRSPALARTHLDPELASGRPRFARRPSLARWPRDPLDPELAS